MKTIIDMAREAGAAVGNPVVGGPEIIFPQCLDVQRFAELVRAEAQAEEREACAKVAGWLWQQFQDTKDAHERNTMESFNPHRFGFNLSAVQQSRQMMDAIRARGNT